MNLKYEFWNVKLKFEMHSGWKLRKKLRGNLENILTVESNELSRVF